jgi:hypothetical protein
MVVPHKTSWFKTSAIYLGLFISLWTLGKSLVLGIASFEATYINFGKSIESVAKEQASMGVKVNQIADDQKESNKVQVSLVTDVAVLKALFSQKPRIIYVQEKRVDNHTSLQSALR